jgi:hypothetical protein
VSARTLAGFVVALFALLSTSVARAQVELDTQIGAHKIELGTSVEFQITAMSGSDEPLQNPRLAPVPGLSISGPSIGTRSSLTFGNGRMLRQTSVTATWNVRALKIGTYHVGPATFDLGGQRFQGRAESLEVVAQGTLPRTPRGGPAPFDPFRFFDPFSGGSPFPPGLFPPNDLDQQPEELPPVPDELKLEKAPDPIAFVRVVVTPKHPVVGEQVTVRFYAYGSRGLFQPANLVDPKYPEFLDYTSQQESFVENPVQVPIGEQVFIALPVRELYLFPLHAGRLSIGQLTVTFIGGRYMANPPITRSSSPVTVEVTEPPLDGRPPGYRVGDVGTLELSVAVDPRRVTAGDTVGVVAKLEGTGSIPTALRVPEQRSVEWLEPTHVDEVHAEHGTVRGFRAFTYLVKMKEPGRVDLGDLTLPYWDPRRRAYAVARANLGKIEVSPSQKPAPVTSASGSAKSDFTDVLALKPRMKLGAYSAKPEPFTDGMRFWYLLLGAPLAVALSGLGVDLGTRLRRRLSTARSSPVRLAQEALRSAEVSAKGSEIAKTAAAVERALFLAIEAGTGIRARALLKDDLRSALVAAGTDAPTVERTLELLDACEVARFTGKSPDLPPKELCARARGLLGELSRKRRSS